MIYSGTLSYLAWYKSHPEYHKYAIDNNLMFSILVLASLCHKDLLLPPRKEHLPQLHPANCAEYLICTFSPS